MSYTKDSWRRRYSERSDLTTGLVHLTKSSSCGDVVDVMYKILAEGLLIGSDTQKGFIVGGNKAVCFQDAPIHSVAQNCWFEQKLRETNKHLKRRYNPCGFLFHKQVIYSKGGRPVIYDKTIEAKKYLPESEWWRIVNFDIDDDNAFIDWTHEREWRVKDEFSFDVEEVTLLFNSPETYKKFMVYCDERNNQLYRKVAGVVVTDRVLF